MDENRRTDEALDEILACLDRMYALAERAAGEICSDTEREELQRELSLLREQIDRAADVLSGNTGTDL